MSDSTSSPSQTEGSAKGAAIGATKEANTATVTSRQSADYRVTCVNCRQRKVKCSRTHPCVACDRSGLSCTFPDRARLPRGRKRGSKATNGEILKRLNKLEELLAQSKNRQEGESGQKGQEREPVQKIPETSGPNTVDGCRTESLGMNRDKGIVEEEGVGGLDRYLGSQFWSSLTNEVEGLKQTLNDDSDEGEDTRTTPESDNSRQNWMFGSSLDPEPLRSLHPPQSEISLLCTLYLRNCDPVYKLLHRPTLQRQVAAASSNLDEIPGGKSMEALLFAIYYSAITSLTPEQCVQMFQADKDSLLKRYRKGVEIALGKADILNTTELRTLQALVIFLSSVRVHDDTRFSWTLTSVAIRIAHALGLNRENANDGYSPFTKEFRRRLWWMIAMLDIRSSEDRGSETMVLEGTFNARVPLNINDEDMDPDSQVITERIGFTEMSFSRIGHDVSAAMRRFNHYPLKVDSEEEPLSLTFEERSRMVTECHQHIEKSYLVYCDTITPITFVATTVARLITNRMYLSLYYPFRHGARISPPQGIVRDHLLQVAVEVLEYARVLEREPTLAQWRWLFGTWVQWHALAVTLAALCIQDEGPLVARAWRIVDVVYDEWAVRIADSTRGMLWRPIKKLMGKAQANRRNKTALIGDLPMMDGTYNSDVTNVQTVPLQMPPLTNLRIPDPSVSGLLGSGGSLPIGTPQLGLPSYQFNPNQQFVPDIMADANMMEPINWAEWDEFMREFEMESQSGGTGNVQQDLQYPQW